MIAHSASVKVTRVLFPFSHKDDFSFKITKRGIDRSSAILGIGRCDSIRRAKLS